MKKTILTIAVALSTVFSAFAGTETPHDNGFRLNFQLGITGGLYGIPYISGISSEVKDELKDEVSDLIPSLTFGFEVGNKFTISRFSEDKMSVGVLVDWLGFNYGSTTVDNGEDEDEDADLVESKRAIFNFNFLEVGPSFTYAVNDDIGVDLYYQIKPTLLIPTFSFGGETDAGDPSIGVSHAVGLGIRYSVFALSLEPNFGSVNVFDEEGEIKTNATHFRINLGFKF